jgi:hypothetical protein
VTGGDLRRDPGLIVASLASRQRITVDWDAMLADLGLAAALNAQVGKSPLPVLVQADGSGGFRKTPRRRRGNRLGRECA